MKRLLTLALIGSLTALGAAACDDDSPTDPSDEELVFRATLSSANEVPPITNAEAGASGIVTITVHPTRDAAGNITDATFDFEGSLNGFAAGTPITAAHIHTGAAGTNGGFVVNLQLSPGEITLANGSGTFSKEGLTANSVDIVNQIIANPAAFYFNAHTQLNPGGAVRGQLVRIN